MANPNPKTAHLAATKWKKGVSANPAGKPKKIPELDKLLADVLSEERGGIDAATAILKKLISKAIGGDVRAAEVLLDRAYGKAKQIQEITGKDGVPIQSESTHTVVFKKYTDEKTVVPALNQTNHIG